MDKKCLDCKERKAIAEFYKNTQAKDGLTAYCKDCVKKRNNARYDKARWRQYYLDRKKHYDEYRHRYFLENQDYIRDRMRKYYYSHRDEMLASMQLWRANNPKKSLAHNLVNKAIYNGELANPQICEYCTGTTTIEFHHLDYDRPLEGLWLCRSCHRKTHRSNDLEFNLELAEMFLVKYMYRSRDREAYIENRGEVGIKLLEKYNPQHQHRIKLGKEESILSHEEKTNLVPLFSEEDS